MGCDGVRCGWGEVNYQELFRTFHPRVPELEKKAEDIEAAKARTANQGSSRGRGAVALGGEHG